MQTKATMLAFIIQHGWAQHAVFIQAHANECNKCQNAMQTNATCWAQQYSVLLANNVASLGMGLEEFKPRAKCCVFEHDKLSNLFQRTQLQNEYLFMPGTNATFTHKHVSLN